MSRQAVSKWEVAQSVPELETVVAMARYFGVSTDWLLAGAAPQAGPEDSPAATTEAPLPAPPEPAPQPQPKNQAATIVVGSVLLGVGVLLVMGILLVGVQYMQQMTAWSTAYPSKLMFAIFAGQSRFADGADGLGLGPFFVGGIVLALAGVGVLLSTLFAGRRPARPRGAGERVALVLLGALGLIVLVTVLLFLIFSAQGPPVQQLDASTVSLDGY